MALAAERRDYWDRPAIELDVSFRLQVKRLYLEGFTPPSLLHSDGQGPLKHPYVLPALPSSSLRTDTPRL